jgi:hypothetical protein
LSGFLADAAVFSVLFPKRGPRRKSCPPNGGELVKYTSSSAERNFTMRLLVVDTKISHDSGILKSRFKDPDRVIVVAGH